MKTYYYPIVSILLFVLSVIAFSDNLFTDIHQESNSDPKFIVHGLFMFAWFGTFASQTYLIARKKYNTHMQWGKVGFVLAIGVFLSTLYVFIAIFKGWDAMEPFVKANRLFMLSFATFVLLAYLYRNDRIKHKRFIFWAIVLPIEPIMGRVTGVFMVDNWQLFYILFWHAFFLSFYLYDWQTLKRIHPISLIAVGWFYLVWAVAIYS